MCPPIQCIENVSLHVIVNITTSIVVLGKFPVQWKFFLENNSSIMASNKYIFPSHQLIANKIARAPFQRVVFIEPAQCFDNRVYMQSNYY